MEEFDIIIKEATQQVEDMLKLEDQGWVNLSDGKDIITSDERKTTIQKARLYSVKDPLCSRAVHLMTDYTFGPGMVWNSDDEKVTEVMNNFWNSKMNASVLSPKGQHKSSDKLLIDGELFLALFLGPNGSAVIRRIDPLEITEIISNPDDVEEVRYYKREWTNPQGQPKVNYYRSFSNVKDKGTPDWSRRNITSTDDALVYHVAINDIGQRGNSYLLPALDWVYLYRKFLAARVAVMLALARFAWKLKTQGGQTAVDAMKAVYHEEVIKAGSTAIENMGADLQPIRTDSGAAQAYQDGRMLKLQVAAATGWPEQYFGDISIGNLATAKTVELPVQKMCESYQSIWAGAYADIDDMVLEHAGIPEDARYVDRDFPAITPEDMGQIALSIQALGMVMPQLLDSRDVQQQALLALGVKDVNEALDQLTKEAKGDPNVALIKALRNFREVIKTNGDMLKVQR